MFSPCSHQQSDRTNTSLQSMFAFHDHGGGVFSFSEPRQVCRAVVTTGRMEKDHVPPLCSVVSLPTGHSDETSWRSKATTSTRRMYATIWNERSGWSQRITSAVTLVRLNPDPPPADFVDPGNKAAALILTRRLR